VSDIAKMPNYPVLLIQKDRAEDLGVDKHQKFPSALNVAPFDTNDGDKLVALLRDESRFINHNNNT
jgi:hypothetical protein